MKADVFLGGTPSQPPVNSITKPPPSAEPPLWIPADQNSCSYTFQITAAK